MAEHPICRYCRKPINLQEDDYVIPNKHEVYGKKDDYEYVHLECQKKNS